MSLSADQLAAFQANGGFTPSAVATLVISIALAVLLLWGVWAIRTAYIGWAENRLSQRQFVALLMRLAAMYLALTFFLLS
jgi:integrating conjugative element protein (TIGR03758 family)